jgi:hypothetical protein
MLLKRSAITAALLCSAAFGLATSAQATTTFSYTGAMQTYTVATTGVYDITLAGGQGGANWYGGGGLGAVVGGDVTLTAGTTLDIVVGGQGINGQSYPGAWASSGGGGSFLLTSGGALLAVAGGGGGSDLGYGNGQPGTVGAPGGGNGGSSNAWDSGGGGAGWLGNGATNGGGYSGGGGYGYPSFAGGAAANNGYNGPAGSFGGGGAGGWDFGAGGGGYTGGDASTCCSGGMGGTSYLVPSFSNVTALGGANGGNGMISISTVTGVPEASTWAMMLAGFAGLGFVGYRRNRAVVAA